MNPTDEVLEQMTVVIDLDGNGMIDFDEFMDLIDKVDTEEKNDKDGKILRSLNFTLLVT